jgi:hypothetical protein
LAGRAARDFKRSHINERDIYMAIENDEELKEFCSDTTIPQSGRSVHTHPELLKSKRKGSKTTPSPPPSHSIQESPIKKDESADQSTTIINETFEEQLTEPEKLTLDEFITKHDDTGSMNVFSTPKHNNEAKILTTKSNRLNRIIKEKIAPRATRSFVAMNRSSVISKTKRSLSFEDDCSESNDQENLDPSSIKKVKKNH